MLPISSSFVYQQFLASDLAEHNEDHANGLNRLTSC